MERTDLTQMSVALWPTGGQQLNMPFDSLRSAFVIGISPKLLKVLLAWL
jgi:hypothetical protein